MHCVAVAGGSIVRSMKHGRGKYIRTLLLLSGMWILAAAPGCSAEEPTPAAVAGFDRYVSEIEARLAEQHQAQGDFLTRMDADPQIETRLHRGEFVFEDLTPSPGVALPGALLHDWRGTAFVRSATTAEFEGLMRNFSVWPQRFAPQVLATQVLAHERDRYQVRMRVRQRHVITVVLDTTYDVTFSRLDARHGYSTSRSTQIDEIGSGGRALNPDKEHGFLWRMETWWSYEERDGGLYMQIESVSLTRSIPTGLGWAVGPYVESVPRDSLQFTLRSVRNALLKQGSDPR